MNPVLIWLRYKPKEFMTTALQQGKVELTWDETDPERKAAMKRAFEVGRTFF
jgi:hypothetical protein